MSAYDESKHPRVPKGSGESSGEWVSIASAIERHLQNHPEFVEHGDTRKNAFFILADGSIVQWKDVKWGTTNLKGAVGVHSHLGDRDMGEKNRGTFSIVDLKGHGQQFKFGVSRHAVITSAKTMDTIEHTPRSHAIRGVNWFKMITKDEDGGFSREGILASVKSATKGLGIKFKDDVRINVEPAIVALRKLRP